MANIYVKRGAICEAEPFDPDRTDQGVTVVKDDEGKLICANMLTMNGLCMVHLGDWIVTVRSGAYPCPSGSFDAMFEPIDAVLTQEVAA